MTAKHTPGPWKTWPALSRAECADYILICAGIEQVAKVETVVDARLIAAAPELLAALQACRIHIETLERMHDHELPEGEMMRAAIAKAEQ